ncbi:hypothetical protein PHAVU_011G137700 [Phaseolus vulgaris]|uniref:Uncharacterized protein n=1 Tax=Phaseolus vulgaris TaxID=3885 RepID=V7AJ81_PHAVU|nr:hypothetical protein PHAVU_011G137700g [Phaseolus vulgaris]ESW04933.1 hypothetical protein PHAVU_011G137700g [Phaseolus vulgaris]
MGVVNKIALSVVIFALIACYGNGVLSIPNTRDVYKYYENNQVDGKQQCDTNHDCGNFCNPPCDTSFCNMATHRCECPCDQ